MDKKIRIACVGDSITAGEGVIDPFEDSYPIQLNCLLGASGFDVITELGRNNAAVWHQSPLPYSETLEYAKAKSIQADILVVCLGTNDTLSPITEDFKKQFIKDYGKLLDELNESLGVAKTYICKIPPIFCDENSNLAEAVPKINKLITEVAYSYNAILIDLNTPLTSRSDLFADDVHPNEEGSRLIAETVYNALKKGLL